MFSTLSFFPVVLLFLAILLQLPHYSTPRGIVFLSIWVTIRSSFPPLFPGAWVLLNAFFVSPLPAEKFRRQRSSCHCPIAYRGASKVYVVEMASVFLRPPEKLLSLNPRVPPVSVCHLRCPPFLSPFSTRFLPCGRHERWWRSLPPHSFCPVTTASGEPDHPTPVETG